MSLAPVPSERLEVPSCANCSAPLAPDQRYCLACGQPVSPVRLSFLDVLSEDATAQPYGAAPGQQIAVLPPGYTPVIEQASGPYAWLRRYSGLLSLLAVLLLAIVAGLLVGHWASQSKAPSNQVVKVEGLGSLAAAAPATSTGVTTTPGASASGGSTAKSAGSGSSSTKETAKTEAHEAQEAKAIEKAPPPKAVKESSSKLKKLGNTTGAKHEEEINKLGAQPIETGG